MASELAYLFLPERPRRARHQAPVQMIFEDDSYILIHELLLDALIDRRQIPLGVDGHWDVSDADTLVSPLPGDFEAWVGEDEQLHLDAFLDVLEKRMSLQ